MRDTGDSTVHIYNICVALLGITAETSGLVHILTHLAALDIPHCVGVHHSTVYLNSTVILWNNQPVALTQYDIVLAARIFHRLVQIDTDRIGAGNVELFEVIILVLLRELC